MGELSGEHQTKPKTVRVTTPSKRVESSNDVSGLDKCDPGMALGWLDSSCQPKLQAVSRANKFESNNNLLLVSGALVHLLMLNSKSLAIPGSACLPLYTQLPRIAKGVP